MWPRPTDKLVAAVNNTQISYEQKIAEVLQLDSARSMRPPSVVAHAPQCHLPHTARVPSRLIARAAPPVTSLPALQDIKTQITQLAGSQNGTDRSEAQRKELASIISQLNELNPTAAPATADLAGTEWVILYTDSTGNSSGKLGPLVGKTGQRFPADTPGQYVNYASFLGGALVVELQGEYVAKGDARINLLFKSTSFSFLGGLLRTPPKEFPNGGVKAHWIMKYVDGDWRVLETNKGSTFVLVKVV